MRDTPCQMRSNLSTNLIHCRKIRGMTQEHLANLCGLHRSYVCSLERGRGNPTLSTLLTIAEVLRMEPAVLLVPDEWWKKFYFTAVDKKK